MILNRYSCIQTMLSIATKKTQLIFIINIPIHLVYGVPGGVYFIEPNSVHLSNEPLLASIST